MSGGIVKWSDLKVQQNESQAPLEMNPMDLTLAGVWPALSSVNSSYLKGAGKRGDPCLLCSWSATVGFVTTHGVSSLPTLQFP